MASAIEITCALFKQSSTYVKDYTCVDDATVLGALESNLTQLNATNDIHHMRLQFMNLVRFVKGILVHLINTLTDIIHGSHVT